MKYFISIALSPEQYCIGIALTEWVTKWSKEYFISIALHSIALAHLHVIFNTNKILMQYCILLVLHYSIALASFFCLGYFIMIWECAHNCKFYPKLRLASGFTLTKSTRMVTLQEVQPYNVTSGLP